MAEEMQWEHQVTQGQFTVTYLDQDGNLAIEGWDGTWPLPPSGECPDDEGEQVVSFDGSPLDVRVYWQLVNGEVAIVGARLELPSTEPV